MKALSFFNTVAVVINLLLRKNRFYFYRLWTNKTNHNIFVVRRKNTYIHHTLGLHIVSSTTSLNNIIKVTQSYILLKN